MREILLFMCPTCKYQTQNKKSLSNHARYGCKNKFTLDISLCKGCGLEMPKRKPSEHGYFCNRACYFNWRNKTDFLKGEDSPLYKTGESRTRLYATWLSMKSRVLKPNCSDYKNYGGRGITICDAWVNDFLSFKSWAIANGYAENLTIERINVNGNYEPANCTWITILEQAKNKRNSKLNKKLCVK